MQLTSACRPMRLHYGLVVVLSLATASRAQEPVPDLTPPHRYFPLSIGDVWEYSECNPDFFLDCHYLYSRRTVVDTVRVEGDLYFVEVFDRLEDGAWTPKGETILRYDSTTARVVIADASARYLWYVTACPLDSPFYTTCEGGGLVVFGSEDGGGGRYPDELIGLRSYKSFGSSDDSQDVLEGVGWIGGYDWTDSTTLRYASVRQDDGTVREYGERYNVASQDRPEAGGLVLSAAPTPTAGPLALAVDAPMAGTVTLEAFDALGRRVWRHEVALGTGRQRVEVDASGWASGLYVVRALAGDAVSTATIVRR